MFKRVVSLFACGYIDENNKVGHSFDKHVAVKLEASQSAKVYYGWYHRRRRVRPLEPIANGSKLRPVCMI